MQPLEVLQRCRSIITEAQQRDPTIPTFDAVGNFLDGARLVTDIIKRWPIKKRNADPSLKPFLIALHKLEGDLSKEIERDPMILYQPAHEVALAFHSSLAFIRYFRGGNRTSKTQSGYAEHYFIATGQHKWRSFTPPPTSSFIIGVNFSKYEPNVFAKKFLIGEADNPLSPMFPEGGKWFNHYDDRKHIVTIACPVCAQVNKAEKCKHLKSTITLFSDLEGPHVLQGGQYNLGHFDEHIREEFFDEAYQRLLTVRKSSFIVTGTPLHGVHAWEHKKLTVVFNQGPSANVIPGTDIPRVSLHTINQYDAGLIPHEDIKGWEAGADPLDIESRVYGRPTPLAKRSVFDRYAVHEMEKAVCQPTVTCRLEDPSLQRNQFNPTAQVRVVPDKDGALNIWQMPAVGQQYVIGCDVAQGLSGSDYSCASVLAVPQLHLVAQYHGWVNPVDFGNELAALGKLYNMAWLVVERNGPGSGTIFTLRALGYWNLFREITDPSQVEFNQDPIYGVDTNIRTKALMVSYLQKAVRERQISVKCAATLEEMRAFGEELTPSGLNTRLRGEGGAHDDRVMSLVFSCYVALAYDLFSYGRVDLPVAIAPQQQLQQSQQASTEDDIRIWQQYRQENQQRKGQRLW